MPRRCREHVRILLDDDVQIDGDLESARLESVQELPFGRSAVRVVITMRLDPATARVWHRHAVAQDRAQRLLPRAP